MEFDKRLETGEIRVLRLLPSTEVDAEIQCKSLRRNFERGTYTALSYVWGDRTPARTILLNGKTSSVTPNLFAALRQLRDAKEEIYLWVDALCINQDDGQEKNAQVSMMGEIYKNSGRVLMWLGEEEADSNVAMELVRHFEEAMKTRARERYIELLTSEEFEPHWKALNLLFQPPYWKRVWIIQEIVLPHLEGILCCGSARASWTYFTLLLRASRGSHNNYSSAVQSTLAMCTVYQLQLAEMCHKMRFEKEKMSFLDGLLVSRNRRATDPRDFVYGILSLVAHNGFEPDYRKPLSTVYRDVVKFIIGQDQNLDILAACPNANKIERIRTVRRVLSPVNDLSASLDKLTIFRSMENFVKAEAQSGTQLEPQSDDSDPPLGLRNEHMKVATDLTGRVRDVADSARKIREFASEIFFPSWVPDWRHGRYEAQYLSLNQPSKCHFKASGTTKPNVRFLNGDYAMVLDGVRIDDVRAISSSPPDSWKLWNRGDHPRDVYGGQESQEAAFLRTIVAGRDINGNKATCNMPLVVLEVVLGGDIPEDRPPVSMPKSDDIFHVKQMVEWYKFCITSQGFMGIIPEGTETDDIIVIFAGAKVPFVLRKYDTQEEYFLIGECCK